MSDLQYIEPGIYRRSNGRWKIGWRDSQGKQRWKTLPSDFGIMAARSALREEISKRERGERIPDNPRMNFNAAATDWLETKVVRLRPASQEVYGYALRHLRDYFGTTKLTDIDPASIAKYVVVKESQGLKGATIESHLSVLSAVFTYAARYKNFPATNPVRLLDRMERPKSDSAAKRALTHEEVARLIAATPERFRVATRVAAQTGMRQSEVLGLRWIDFGWHEMTLTVSGQLSRKGKRVPTKTAKSMRTLEITPSLAAEISALPRRGEFIFCDMTGKPYPQRGLGATLTKAAAKAGLEPVSFHELRHSHASALIADGWDVQQVADRLGDSIGTVLSIYAHQFDAANRSTERRDRLTSLYDPGSMLEAHTGSSSRQQAVGGSAEIVHLQDVRKGRQ